MARQDNASLTAGDMAESDHAPDVTVVIPCLNERVTIAEAVMQAQVAFAHWPEGVEVVVDNGSTDGSAELARAKGARVVAAFERGYGAALQAGFAAARTASIVYADADLTYDFSEGPRLVQALRASQADMNLSHYQSMHPDVNGRDSQQRVEARGKALPPDYQTTIFLLKPGKCPLSLKPRDHFLDRPTSVFLGLPDPLRELRLDTTLT